MSTKKKNVFLSAFIAALIGTAVTTYITLRLTTPQAQHAVVTIVPSEVARIATRDGYVARSSPTSWTTHLDAYDRDWPASPGAVRAALRAAGDIASLESAGDTPSQPPTNVITLTLDDGTPYTLAISDTAIGGKHTVVLNGNRTVRAPAELVATLTAGPRSWRDTSLFPNAGPDVTRLYIRQPATDTDPAREIDLTRTAGRWLIVSPALARASEEAMRSAIGRVASSSIARFLDDAPADLESGLDEPDFVITVEAGDDVRRIAFAAHADAAGAQRFATTGAGHYFIADTSLLRELRLDPAAYTDRHPSPVVPADVHAIRIDSARAQRTLTGWTDAPFDPAAILDLLTSDTGAVVVFEEPDSWEQLTTVTLESLAAEPLDIIAIGTDAAATLYARTQLPGGGPVYYSLPRDAAPSFLGSAER